MIKKTTKQKGAAKQSSSDLKTKLFKCISRNDIVHLYMPAKEYEDSNEEFVKKLLDRGYVGIYVSVNKPYHALVDDMREIGINTDHIFFIDLISNEITREHKGIDNCIFVNSPSNLTDLSIVVNEVFQAIKTSKKFFIFDAISTLLIYNDSKIIEKFVHYLTSRMNVLDVGGILLSMEHELDERTRTFIDQFCDTSMHWGLK